MKYEYKYDIFGMIVGVIPIAEEVIEDTVEKVEELPAIKKTRKKKGE